MRFQELLYRAPTGGGKTLVAEILVLRQVTFARRRQFCCPTFPLCMRRLTLQIHLALLQSSKDEKRDRLKVKELHGEMGILDKSVWRADIVITTVEKAASLVNLFIERKKIDRVGIVVVDEMHAVGAPFRATISRICLRSYVILPLARYYWHALLWRFTVCCPVSSFVGNNQQLAHAWSVAGCGIYND